jgi:hypothetical protein
VFKKEWQMKKLIIPIIEAGFFVALMLISIIMPLIGGNKEE